MGHAITTSNIVHETLRELSSDHPLLHSAVLDFLKGLTVDSGQPLDEWGDIRQAVIPFALVEFFLMPSAPEIHVVRLVSLDFEDGRRPPIQVSSKR